MVVSPFSPGVAVLLQRARTHADTFLRSFGIHCATHQIRLILISAVVITSLSYPALAIYWSTPSYARLVSTSNVLDSFLQEHVASGSRAQRDLQHFWQGHHNLQLREDAVARARCGFDRTLRVERILVRSNTAEEAGALTYQTLSSTLQFERRILERVNVHGSPCLRANPTDCFVLSPLAFWDHDEERLHADFNISNTLKHYDEVTIAGIPLTPEMVLAGRNYDWTGNINAALFLVLTFVFIESDCSGNAGHSTWLQILANSTHDRVDVFAEAVEPKLIALEYDHSLARNKSPYSISSFVYLAYGIFFFYVSWSMKRMKGVHTRIGLTFTALFEIAASTITSLSVCALMRFRVNMVPWSLLPIVIIFVGAENMFNLVDAVTKTSVTLSVKERVAEGLSRAGTSNTLKVVSYNAILGAIAYFSAGAIRQFCAFAVVVLVAHWFLAHTFFLAVLSIDIQRLELDELLRQNPSLTPAVATSRRDSTPPNPAPWWQRITYLMKDLLKSRATKNISLLLLLAITATLYFMTRPSIRDQPDIGITFPPAFPRFSVQSDRHEIMDPAWRIWKVLNSEEDPLVHLRIEVPTIVAFRPDLDVGQTARYHLGSSSPRLDFIVWLLKILVLPMLVTLVPLYGLLLYLLKDAELLEAQRNRGGGDTTVASAPNTLNHVTFSTLPRSFTTDIELLATSGNGRVHAAVGLQNELSIWRPDEKEPICVDTDSILAQIPTTSSVQLSISALAVDSRGDLIAFGTSSGVIHVGSFNGTETKFHQPLVLIGNQSEVKELHFVSLCSMPLQKLAPNSRPTSPASSGVLIALYDSGIVASWKLDALPTHSFIHPKSSSSPVARSHFLRIRSSDRFLLAFSFENGSLEVTEVAVSQETSPISTCLRAGNPFDKVAKVDACCTQSNDTEHLIVCVASEAGVISLWDADSAECLLIMGEPRGTIGQLRVAAVRSETCHFCGELPLDSSLVALSIGHTVTSYRVYITSQTRRCSCPGNVPRQGAVLSSGMGLRSRSSSTISASGSPTSARRLSAVSSSSISDTTFPVSGHGRLSRRASEKESLRRPPEIFSLPSSIDEQDGHSHPVGPVDSTLLHPVTPSRATFIRIGEASCERGGWDIIEGKVVGIRRMSRPQAKSKVGSSGGPCATQSWGLTEGVLDRWECWSYEPKDSSLRACTLSRLCEGSRHPSLIAKQSHNTLGAGVDYPRLPFTRVTGFRIVGSTGIAGFGNTVGIFHFS
ncbi:sterol-sensing domain of SREBP cleavage-activation-domain-containing protein [Pisolithus marmoratus]|nr:sterol-sensing domain of SREBP cleavage-activation-domain-containing protein [Pisolithus marmoratus]